MSNLSDAELLRAYVADRNEPAFTQIVTRHLPLVYHTALRLTKNAHIAEEVSQEVFSSLARKAPSLELSADLGPWLYRAARFEAANTVRSNRRRLSRETAASLMTTPQNPPNQDADPLDGLLDVAIGELEEDERQIIIHRFLQGTGLREVGKALGISEDAAQKRVSRAISKLALVLSHRGVRVTEDGLASTLGSHAGLAVPVGLVAAVSTAAMSGTAAATALGIGVATGKMLALAATCAVAGLAGGFWIRELGLPSESKDETTNGVVRASASNNTHPLPGSSEVELQELRNTAAEVHRLRGEVAQLRLLQKELLAQNEALTQSVRELQASEGDGDAPDETADQIKELAGRKMNLMSRWMVAFHLFANENGGSFPASFDEAQSYLLEAAPDTDPASASIEIMYSGPFERVQNPSDAIVIREKEAWPGPEGSFLRAYGFADGHSEIHREPTEDFSTWEATRQPILGQPAAGAQPGASQSTSP